MPDRKVFISGGITVFIAPLGLFASGWPEYIRVHPAWVAGVATFGVLMIIYGTLFAPTASKSPTQGIKSGRDNSGSQYNAGRDLYVRESAKESDPRKEAEQPKQPLFVASEFDISPRPAYVTYALSPGCWRECRADDKDAKPALLLDIVREVPPLGKKGKHSVKVMAVLKFSTPIGIERVPRAYWLNQQDYRAGFIVGHKESLIIGTIETPFLVSYTNPQYGELMEDQFPNLPFRDCGPRTEMPGISFIVEVSLCDWHETSTIQQNRVAADVQNGRFLVSEYS